MADKKEEQQNGDFTFHAHAPYTLCTVHHFKPAQSLSTALCDERPVWYVYVHVATHNYSMVGVDTCTYIGAMCTYTYICVCCAFICTSALALCYNYRRQPSHNWASGSKPTLVISMEPPSYTYMFIYYICSLNLLAFGWPRPMRKCKANRLAPAHMVAKCSGSVYSLQLKLVSQTGRKAKASNVISI